MNCCICGDVITFDNLNLVYPPNFAAITKTLHEFLSSPVIRFLDKIDVVEENPNCCKECLSKITEYDKTFHYLNQIEYELQKLFYNKVINDPQKQQSKPKTTEPIKPLIENIPDEFVETVELMQQNQQQQQQQKPNESIIEWYSSLEEIENAHNTNDVIDADNVMILKNKIHVLRIHDTEDINQIHPLKTVYQCSECDETFGRKKKLKIHLNAHLRQFKGLKPHNFSVQRGPRYVQCEICGKTYNALTYDKHKLIHVDVRPVKCTLCDKRFLNSGEIKRHMPVHTKERPFQCGKCDKTFSFNSSKLSHEKHHHGPPGQNLDDLKKYQCQICQSRFESNYKLNRHLRIKHEIAVTEINT